MNYEIYEKKNKIKNYKFYVFKTKINGSFVILKFVMNTNNFILEFTIDKKINWDTFCICTSTDVQYYKQWKNIIKFKNQKINIKEFNGIHKKNLMSKQRIQICEDIINFAFKKMYIFFGL